MLFFPELCCNLAQLLTVEISSNSAIGRQKLAMNHASYIPARTEHNHPWIKFMFGVAMLPCPAPSHCYLRVWLAYSTSLPLMVIRLRSHW